ncbi:hypothetical protein ACET3Z_009862 [Daucus carota]
MKGLDDKLLADLQVMRFLASALVNTNSGLGLFSSYSLGSLCKAWRFNRLCNGSLTNNILSITEPWFHLGGRFARYAVMKDKNSTSVLKRVLVKCGAQSKEYGSCVAAKVPEVEQRAQRKGLVSPTSFQIEALFSTSSLNFDQALYKWWLRIF